MKTNSFFLLALVVLVSIATVQLACNSGSSPTEPESPAPGSFGGSSSGGQSGQGQQVDGPSLDIEKSTNGEDADVAPGPEVLVGDPVTWTYLVTNNGSVGLQNVSVSDDQIGAVTCPETDLAVGEFMTCEVLGTATLGQYENTGTATGEDSLGSPASDSDMSHYLGTLVGIIEIEKSTNGQDADIPPGPEIPVGDPVTWTYLVTNNGSFNLQNVSISDDQIGAITCPQTTLAVGESMTCTANGVAAGGQYANLGSVTATGPEPDFHQVGDEDPSHYFGVAGGTDEEGCSHGYWKNHLDSWAPTGYSPDDSVDYVFTEAAAFPALGSATLMEALKFGGGPGAEGGAKILLRQAVAALLNAAHPDIAYPRTVTEVFNEVNAALASGDRETMLVLKDGLDADNNLGCTVN